MRHFRDARDIRDCMVEAYLSHGVHVVKIEDDFIVPALSTATAGLFSINMLAQQVWDRISTPVSLH